MYLNSIIKFSLAMLCALPAGLSLQAQDATPKTYDPYPASIPINYIRTWDALAPVTDPNQLMAKPRKEVIQATAYVDGLGRPWQTVVKYGAQMANGTKTDLVNVQIYDEYGREVRSYLPYVSADVKGVIKYDPFQQQAAFYNTSNINSPVHNQGETFFYGKTEYEASPLNKAERTYAPGNSWVNQGKGVKVQYLMNTINDEVRIWNVNDVSNDFAGYASSGEYTQGELYKTITTDEANHQVIEFKDKAGLVILKKVQVNTITDNGTGSSHNNWLCTYYIYDDYHLLRAVIQPEGVKYLQLHGWDPTGDGGVILKEQIFRYEYDHRDRMIMKKVPGAGVVNMVYDNRDRLVMSQDAMMADASKKQWIYTQYDELNRPVATYLITDPDYFNNAAWHRTEFKNGTHPARSTYASELLTEIHYDNYDGIPNGLTASLNGSGYAGYLNAGPDEYPDPVTATNLVNGLVTWTRTKVLNENKYIESCNLYDEKKRVIQVQSRNYTGGLDIITNQYSFSGQLLRSHIKHEKGGGNPQTYELATKNNYDDLGRITSVEKNVNNGGWKEIASMTYDALGQLKKKIIALDSLEYDYNIRGWLLGANREYAKDPSKVSHYFGFDLGYDKQTIASLGSYGQAQYNGNITGTVWKSKGDNEVRKYDFTYDPVNRLTGADFNQYSSGFNKTAGVDFSVSNLTYDANGNILSQAQKGLKGNVSTFIDQMKYSYNDYSNRLKNVIDTSNDPQTKLGDFRSSQTYMTQLGTKTTGATDYDYDVNGNLKLDNNKDIESISYNHLNLPRIITIKNNKGSIEYVYDAAGVKLEKIVKETNKPDKHTLYLFGIYEDDKLQFLPMEEGRIRPLWNGGNSITSYTYDYFIKDHLGNVRMVLTEEQKTDLYQAGMEDAKRSYEVALFGDKINSTAANKPGGFDNDEANAKVSVVNGTTAEGRVGPGVILKVMAGDKFTAKTFAWYQPIGMDNDPQTGLQAIITNLLGQLVPGITGVGKGSGAELVTNSTLQPGMESFLGTQNPGSGAPKAYLSWVLLDEKQFKMVSGGVTPVQQITGTQEKQLLQANNGNTIDITKNGYLYVYVSNESKGNVYFDDIRVEHIKGPLLEETHYYPFGLTMAGISSKALNFGTPENKYKFNGAELNTSFDLNSYEFFYRTYDPQIGRWHSLDTKPVDIISPYAAMANNPIRFTDPLGDTAVYFRPDGSFWKFQDDGKKEFSGVFFQKSTVTSTYEKDGVQYEVHTYSDGVNFQFNDAAVDVQAIKNGEITNVAMATDALVNNEMEKSGVNSADPKKGFSYAKENSTAGGKMDYGMQPNLLKNTFYLREGTAYNVADFGNYLWGRGMAQLEVDLPLATIGAHYNNFVNGRRGRDVTEKYNFGPGTYGSPGLFDSKSDQRAIISGYMNNPKYPMLQQREYDRYKGIPYIGH